MGELFFLYMWRNGLIEVTPPILLPSIINHWRGYKGKPTRFLNTLGPADLLGFFNQLFPLPAYQFWSMAFFPIRNIWVYLKMSFKYVRSHHVLISFPTAFWFQQQNPGPNIIFLFHSHFILQPFNSQPPSLSLDEKFVRHLSLFDTWLLWKEEAIRKNCDTQRRVEKSQI